MRVAVINVCESGHNVLDAVIPQLKEFLGEGAEIVARGNLFVGLVDINEETLQDAVLRVDATLENVVPKADVIVVVLTGPYIVAFTALQRVIRRAAYKVILIAQFDFQRKKYVFVEDRKLLEIIHRG